MAISAIPSVFGANYPDRPIKFVVPFAPGSSTDIAARIYAKVTSTALKGASVIVDNRAGAGGNLGADAVATAAPDGYTIMYSAATPVVIAPLLYRDLPYVPSRDFEPIAVTVSIPLALVVAADSGIQNMDGLAAKIRSNPNAVAYGSNGVGTSSHITAKAVANALGVPELTHVPYRQGSQGVMTDVIGGRLTFAVDVWSVVGPLVKSGRLRALAVTSPTRLSAAQGVPTLAELFKNDMEIVTWNGLWAPAGTPRAIVTELHRAVNTLREDKALVAQFEEQGTPLLPLLSIEKTKEFIARENQRWKTLIEGLGIRL